MRTVTYNNHKIEMTCMTFTGKEKVWYDGELVSSKFSVTGATHLFSVIEDGKEIQYEVEIGLRWHSFSAWVTVRRNGIVIFTDR